MLLQFDVDCIGEMFLFDELKIMIVVWEYCYELQMCEYTVLMMCVDGTRVYGCDMVRERYWSCVLYRKSAIPRVAVWKT